MISYRSAALFSLVALGLLVQAGPLSAQATQRQPADVVASLPIEIPEVISGGLWRQGDRTGVYRAIVVLVPAPPGLKAEVHIQWLGLSADKAAPAVVTTMAVEDFSRRRLGNAQLSLEAEKDNEVIIIVTSYDEAQKRPVVLAYRATAPGEIAPAELPKEPVAAPPAKKQ